MLNLWSKDSINVRIQPLTSNLCNACKILPNWDRGLSNELKSAALVQIFNGNLMQVDTGLVGKKKNQKSIRIA